MAHSHGCSRLPPGLADGATVPRLTQDASLKHARSLSTTLRLLVSCACLLASPGAGAQQRLPSASESPLQIDFARDPVLQLRTLHADEDVFRAAVAKAVASSPIVAESLARRDESSAYVREMRDGLRPSAAATVQSYRVLARDFDQADFDNIVERSRPLQRTDVLLQADQPLFDFGGKLARLRSAQARDRAVGAEAERLQSNLALDFIATWYDIASYRAFIDVMDAFLGIERAMRDAVSRRIAEGASAQVDSAEIDAIFAQALARRAGAARTLAAAEARYLALAGTPPPADLRRPPNITPPIESAAVVEAAGSSPAVRSAEALGEAARSDARAARAAGLPSVTAGVDAGRYGLLERERDFDVRARVILRAPLFGGGFRARADQADARARAAEAAADRVRMEAERDAQIAIADIGALETQLGALEQSYRAARVSRDAIVARFLSQRGTLAEMARAEDRFVGAATAYIQGVGEMDAARYVLMARTGQLLDVLGISRPRSETGHDR